MWILVQMMLIYFISFQECTAISWGEPRIGNRPDSITCSAPSNLAEMYRKKIQLCVIHTSTTMPAENAWLSKQHETGALVKSRWQESLCQQCDSCHAMHSQCFARLLQGRNHSWNSRFFVWQQIPTTITDCFLICFCDTPNFHSEGCRDTRNPNAYLELRGKTILLS